MKTWRGAVGVLACAVLLTALSVQSWAAAPPDGRPTYLALGDSVAFGFIDQAGFAYVNPNNFIASSAYAGAPLGLRAINAACPGETTASFLSATGTDNGCREFRSQFPLHVPYSGTQMDYATAFLRSHRQTQLVTVEVGANDLLLLESSCNLDPQCIAAGFASTLATVGENVAAILHNLRDAGYRGIIVVVNYYSPDYTDPLLTFQAQELNQSLTAAAAAGGAYVADVFSAFQQAAANPFSAGQTCKAGLLNASPQNQLTCDRHPSQSGQQLIAATVVQTYAAARHGK